MNRRPGSAGSRGRYRAARGSEPKGGQRFPRRRRGRAERRSFGKASAETRAEPAPPVCAAAARRAEARRPVLPRNGLAILPFRRPPPRRGGCRSPSSALGLRGRETTAVSVEGSARPVQGVLLLAVLQHPFAVFVLLQRAAAFGVVTFVVGGQQITVLRHACQQLGMRSDVGDGAVVEQGDPVGEQNRR